MNKSARGLSSFSLYLSTSLYGPLSSPCAPAPKEISRAPNHILCHYPPALSPELLAGVSLLRFHPPVAYVFSSHLCAPVHNTRLQLLPIFRCKNVSHKCLTFPTQRDWRNRQSVGQYPGVYSAPAARRRRAPISGHDFSPGAVRGLPDAAMVKSGHPPAFR